MALGFRSLEWEGNHIYGWSSHDYWFQFLAALGVFLLFVGFVLLMGVSTYLSRKLSAIGTLLAGIAVLLGSAASWKIVDPLANVHAWTFSLLVVPLTCFLSGALLAVRGGVRLIAPRLRRQ
jgi:predicted Kef-type K+ transport protein